VRALALDAPAQARPAMTAGIVIDADDSQVLEPAPRQPEQQAVDGCLVFG